MILNTRELTDRFAKDIREASVYGALAYSAIHGLKSDDISENDAFKKYGRTWVEQRLLNGQLHFTRNGSTTKSTKVYSVFEIETLKRSEKHVEEYYQIAIERGLL